MNGAEIKQVIEDALNFALDGGSSGAFPYGAGIRFEATKAGTLGTRVKKVEVLDAKTNKWVPIDAGKTYTVGTNSYIAAGKDGYTTFGKITSTPGREGVNTHLGVETSFINYVKEKNETIQLVVKGNDNNIYMLGNNYDYQFSGKDADRLLRLSNFPKELNFSREQLKNASVNIHVDARNGSVGLG